MLISLYALLLSDYLHHGGLIYGVTQVRLLMMIMLVVEVIVVKVEVVIVVVVVVEVVVVVRVVVVDDRTLYNF